MTTLLDFPEIFFWVDFVARQHGILLRWHPPATLTMDYKLYIIISYTGNEHSGHFRMPLTKENFLLSGLTPYTIYNITVAVEGVSYGTRGSGDVTVRPLMNAMVRTSFLGKQQMSQNSD